MTPVRGRDGDASAPLGRERIEELLAELDRRLRLRGAGATLYVVGGAAVAVTVADRRVTRDVDVAGIDVVLAEEARALASAQGLPPDWLNADAAPWIPPRVKDPVPVSGLTVRFAPPEHLLAMKMVSLRQQDAADIAALADVLGLSGGPEDSFAQLLHAAYVGDGVLAQVLGVPDHQVHDEVRAITRRVAAFTARPTA